MAKSYLTYIQIKNKDLYVISFKALGTYIPLNEIEEDIVRVPIGNLKLLHLLESKYQFNQFLQKNNKL